MNKKLPIFLILGIVVFHSLCAGNEGKQTAPTLVTPQKTPIQTPRETPPPGMQTPLTPDYYVGKFVEYFNERNPKLYDLFSDKIKRNRSIDELEKLLKIAEERNVTIVKWRIVEGRYFPGNVTVEIKISSEGKIHNETIVIPMIYKPLKKDNEIVHVAFIDDWIIDNILKAS